MMIGFVCYHWCCLTFSLNLCNSFSLIAHISLSQLSRSFAEVGWNLRSSNQSRATIFYIGRDYVYLCMFQAFLLFISFSPFVPYSQDIAPFCVHKKIEFFFRSLQCAFSFFHISAADSYMKCAEQNEFTNEGGWNFRSNKLLS